VGILAEWFAHHTKKKRADEPPVARMPIPQKLELTAKDLGELRDV